MRFGLLLGLLGLAGCMAADPLPMAGARAQAERLEGAPASARASTMSLPYVTAQGSYEVTLAQVRGEDGGLVEVGSRTAPALNEAQARQVAEAGCLLVGRTPSLDGALQEGDRWSFAGGCQ